MAIRNVLFVPVDDLRPQLGCYGVNWIQTPNIDSLASSGVVMDRAYCQQAVCAPSRASVLSGCRPDTTGIYDLATPLRTAMPEVLTLPQHFKRNGYTTVSIGKVYHHAQDDLEGWSKPPFQSTGDWQGRGYLTDEAIEAMTKHAPVRAARGDTRPGVGPAYEAADVDDEGYHDGLDAGAAIRALRELHEADSPFFLAVGFHKPHLPFNAPKRYWDLYTPTELPLAPNRFEPEGAPSFALTDFGELRGYFGIPREGDIPEDLAQTLIHGYAACVSYMDAQLGRVLAELHRLDLWKDTAVMLWGDHGWKLGEHNSWCKHTNFEIDTRAPLIVRAPGVAAEGAHASGLVEFVDMYPTLCELCGIEVPNHVEGSSFLPLLANPAQEWKPAVFSQYPRGEVMGYTMRTNRYRYTEWKANKDGSVAAREVYDHESDPQENVNIAESADPNLIDTLSKQLAAGPAAEGSTTP
jgi:arylsulfatase A-like enzyme